MSDDLGTSIARFTTVLAEPLVRGFSSPVALQSLMRRVGWRTSVSDTNHSTVKSAFAIVGDAESLVTLLEAIYAAGEPTSAQIQQLITDAAALVQNLAGLQEPGGGVSIAPFDQAGFWETFPVDLLNLLLVEALRGELPIVHGLFVGLGVVRYRMVDPPGTGASPWQVPYEQRQVDWSAIPSLISDPAKHFQDLYGVGGALREIELLSAIEHALGPLGVPARRVPIAPSRAARRAPGARAQELILPILEGAIAGHGSIALGVIVTPVPAQPTAASVVDGLLISSLAHGQASTSIEIAPDIALQLAGGFDADGALAVEVSPRGVDPTINLPGRIEAKALVVGEPEKPWVLIGDPDGSHVALAGFIVGLEVRGDPTDPEVIAVLGTGITNPDEAFAVVIDLKEGDSFLGAILGTDPQRIEAGGVLRWSSVSGLAFEGGGGFEFTRPMRVSIGPVSIDRLTIAFRASTSGGVKLWAAIDGRVEIGPIKAVVERIGVEMRLVTGQMGKPGAVGDLGVAFGFKPPDGLGARVQAAIVTGGGFISLDPDNGRYAGVLQLRVGPIGVAAIGLLDTRLPGGVPGYSLLVAISATFPSIQLGYGFALLGLGGIVGIHRSMDTQALSAGLKSGVLDGLLFPEDPISQAPQIISGIRAIFPPVADHFVFGPMIRLGWASLITVDVAVVLAIGGPFKLVILGRIGLALPAPGDEAIVELRVDVIGYLDMGEKAIAIEGLIHHSRIAAFPISGGLAFRLTWGETSTFGISIGGFHPRFTPPPGFPSVARMTIGLAEPEGNPRISLWTYFAVTTNSVQFGGGLDLHAAAFGAVVSGAAEFHALFQFTPFTFEVSFKAHVEVSFKGVGITLDVDVALTGPTPWHAIATVNFRVIFEFRVTVEITSGEATEEAIAAEDPTERLRAAFVDPSNWQAVLPAGVVAAVRLRAIDPALGPVLDPLGAAAVTERVVPLNRTLTRLGTAPIAGPGRYEVKRVAVGGVDSQYTTLTDRFAPAQFGDYTDDQKLTLPSFEQMPAGFQFRTAGATSGAALVDADDLLTVVVDDDYPPPVIMTAPAGVAVAASQRMRGLGARAANRETAFPAAASQVALAPEQFAIADPGTAAATSTARFDTRSEALEAAARQAEAAGSDLRLDVAPEHEVAA